MNVKNINDEAKMQQQIGKIKELDNKMLGGHIRNWPMVLNQLMIEDHFNYKRTSRYLSK